MNIAPMHPNATDDLRNPVTVTFLQETPVRRTLLLQLISRPHIIKDRLLRWHELENRAQCAESTRNTKLWYLMNFKFFDCVPTVTATERKSS